MGKARELVDDVRRDPKNALGEDLRVAVVGLFVAFVGAVTSAGLWGVGVGGARSGLSTPVAPANERGSPVLGGLVFMAGLWMVAIGLLLVLVVLVVWATGIWRRPSSAPLPERPTHPSRGSPARRQESSPWIGPIVGAALWALAGITGGLAWSLGADAGTVLGGLALLAFVAGTLALSGAGVRLLVGRSRRRTSTRDHGGGRKGRGGPRRAHPGKMGPVGR